MKPRNLIIAVALGVALASGVFVSTRIDQPPALRSALAIPSPQALPEFSLLDQFGAAITRDAFRGQWDMVFFGFTHCPDICPTTLQLLAAAKRELAESGVSPLPRIVLVSVDPERDSPQVLRQYIDYFGDDNLGVGGDLVEVKKLTSALGIYFEKSNRDGDLENYGVDHSAAVIVVDPSARFAALFSSPHLVENLVHDLPIIMGSD